MITPAGTVVVAPFPFAEASLSERRPALVMSEEWCNNANGMIVLAMITTARRRRWDTDIVISDLGAAGLRETCFVRLRLGSVANEVIERESGRLATVDLRAVRVDFMEAFGWRD